MKKLLSIILCLILGLSIVGCTSNSKTPEKQIIPTIKTNRLIVDFENIDFEYWRIGESLYIKNNSDKPISVEFTFKDEDGLQEFYDVSITDLNPNDIGELFCSFITWDTNKEVKYKAFEIQNKAISVYPDRYDYDVIKVYKDDGSDFWFWYDLEKEQFYHYGEDENTQTYCNNTGKQEVEINIDEDSKSVAIYGNVENEEDKYGYDWSYRFNSDDEWIEGGLNDTKKEISEQLNLIESLE